MDIRVLHVLYSLNPGGVEYWLTSMARLLKPHGVRFDYACVGPADGTLAGAARDIGSQVFDVAPARRPLTLMRDLRRLLRDHRYDVINAHDVTWAAASCCAGRLEHTARRLFHVHSNMLKARPGDTAGRLYLNLSVPVLRRTATAVVAVSADAAAAASGRLRLPAADIVVVPCGVDLSALAPDVTVLPVDRASLGIAADSVVIGHVGSFRPEKNQDLIVEVMHAANQQGAPWHAVMLGDGAGAERIRTRVANLALQGCVTLPGHQAGTAPYLRGLFDVFLFPSLSEGAGLALVEAQAAGLPCVVSDAVPSDVIVNREAVTVMSRQASVTDWVEAVTRAVQSGKVNAEVAFQRACRSPYDITRSAEAYARLIGRELQ